MISEGNAASGVRTRGVCGTRAHAAHARPSRASLRAVAPLPNRGARAAGDDTQRPAHRPPRGHIVKEDNLQDESKDHIHSLHYCHRPCLFYLDGFREKHLTPQTKQADEDEKQPVQAAVGQTPLPQDEEDHDALQQPEDDVIPDAQEVVHGLAHPAEDDQSQGGEDRVRDRGDRALQVDGVVPVPARRAGAGAEQERGPHDKDHAGDGEDGEEGIPRAVFLLEKYPSKDRREHGRAKGDNRGVGEGCGLESVVQQDHGRGAQNSSEKEENALTFGAYKPSSANSNGGTHIKPTCHLFFDIAVLT